MAPTPRLTECHPDRKHYSMGKCRRCYNREYMRDNPEKRQHKPVLSEKSQEYNARFRSKRRQAVLDAYGNSCECCGETQPIFLQIDHIAGGGNIERKSGIADMAYHVYRQGFPDKYRLLCANCNWGVYLNGGICPHRVGE